MVRMKAGLRREAGNVRDAVERKRYHSTCYSSQIFIGPSGALVWFPSSPVLVKDLKYRQKETLAPRSLIHAFLPCSS